MVRPAASTPIFSKVLGSLLTSSNMPTEAAELPDRRELVLVSTDSYHPESRERSGRRAQRVDGDVVPCPDALVDVAESRSTLAENTTWSSVLR